MHMGLKVFKKQGICERIFHFQKLFSCCCIFFVKLFVAPQEDDDNPMVFFMFKVVMARGRRLKKLGGDLKAHKQNVSSTKLTIGKQNVVLIQQKLGEQNVAPLKLGVN